MIRESQNYVVIEGILSEINLSLREFTKNGVKHDAIGGDIKVKVVQDVEGQDVELEVPVNMFSGKLTNKGGENPSYVSIKRVMDEFRSIAAVGEEDADRIRITGAKIVMNEYYTPDGRLMSYPRVQASFVTRIKPEDCKMRATWEMELYVQQMGFRTDREGIETSTFELKGINVGYGENADVIPVITNQGNIAAGLNATYSTGDTVPLSGKLNFTSITETILEEVEIGDPIEKVRTVNISDLVITGAKGAKEEGAYTTEEIKTVLVKREEKLANLQSRAAFASNMERRAPSATQDKVGLGF